MNGHDPMIELRGSPPLARLDDIQSIDDCTLVYDDIEVDDFGTVIDPCDRSFDGQHQYSIADGHQRCIHCGGRRLS